MVSGSGLIGTQPPSGHAICSHQLNIEKRLITLNDLEVLLAIRIADDYLSMLTGFDITALEHLDIDKFKTKFTAKHSVDNTEQTNRKLLYEAQSGSTWVVENTEEHKSFYPIVKLVLDQKSLDACEDDLLPLIAQINEEVRVIKNSYQIDKDFAICVTPSSGKVHTIVCVWLILDTPPLPPAA